MENNKLPGSELYYEVAKVLWDFHNLSRLVFLTQVLEIAREREQPVDLKALKEIDKLVDVLGRFSKNIKAQDLYGHWG